jgi:hypothetical protein
MNLEFKKYFSNSSSLLKWLSKNISGICWFLGRNAFMFILIFILLDLVIGEVLFYQYAFLAQVKDPEIVLQAVYFQENTYVSVLKEWKEKKLMFDNVSREVFQNPFR